MPGPLEIEDDGSVVAVGVIVPVTVGGGTYTGAVGVIVPVVVGGGT
jgi:hypothetical protein